MHIQENHYYMSRQGTRVGPVERNGPEHPGGWPWKASGFHFTALGRISHDTASPMDIVAPWPGASLVQSQIRTVRSMKVGVWLDFGILMASVTVEGDKLSIDSAWLEPAGSGVKIPLKASTLGSLSALRGNLWKTFEQLIFSRTQDEIAA
jgi:hypothetical protein